MTYSPLSQLVPSWTIDEKNKKTFLDGFFKAISSLKNQGAFNTKKNNLDAPLAQFVIFPLLSLGFSPSEIDDNFRSLFQNISTKRIISSQQAFSQDYPPLEEIFEMAKHPLSDCLLQIKNLNSLSTPEQKNFPPNSISPHKTYKISEKDAPQFTKTDIARLEQILSNIGTELGLNTAQKETLLILAYLSNWNERLFPCSQRSIARQIAPLKKFHKSEAKIAEYEKKKKKNSLPYSDPLRQKGKRRLDSLTAHQKELGIPLFIVIDKEPTNIDKDNQSQKISVGPLLNIIFSIWDNCKKNPNYKKNPKSIIRNEVESYIQHLKNTTSLSSKETLEEKRISKIRNWIPKDQKLLNDSSNPNLTPEQIKSCLDHTEFQLKSIEQQIILLNQRKSILVQAKRNFTKNTRAQCVSTYENSAGGPSFITPHISENTATFSPIIPGINDPPPALQLIEKIDSYKTEDPNFSKKSSPENVTNSDREAYKKMLNAYESLGIKKITLNEWVEEDTGKKAGPSSELSIEELSAQMESILINNRTKKKNYSIYLKSEALNLILVDDIRSLEQFKKMLPFACYGQETSPSSYQLLFALEGSKNFTRKRLTGKFDTSATFHRLPGIKNWKPERGPDFPIVKNDCFFSGGSIGRVTNESELLAEGIIEEEIKSAPSTKVTNPPAEFSSSSKNLERRWQNMKKWPSYERALNGAPKKSNGEPDRSVADLHWAGLCLDWGFTVEETAGELSELSEKVKEGKDPYADALRTVQCALKSRGRYR